MGFNSAFKVLMPNTNLCLFHHGLRRD